jgi:hypothetical protein
LVASTILSRAPDRSNQVPMKRSLSPSPVSRPYMFAVSTKLIPAPRARSRTACDSGSPICQAKFMVPRQIRLTRNPVRPRGV